MYQHLIRLCIVLAGYTTQTIAQTPVDNITVFNGNDLLPKGAEKIQGNLKIAGHELSTVCSYTAVLQKAREKASEEGGNIIQINRVKEPDVLNSCYRLWIDIYKAQSDSILSCLKSKQDKIMAKISSIVPDTAKYAVLFIYRPGSFIGSAISYNIHLDDTTICRISNNSKFAIKVYKTGPVTIWTRTEAREEQKLDIQPGHAYFLNCSVSMGIIVGHPQINLVAATQGYPEYETINYPGKPDAKEGSSADNDIYR